jgi:SAM-dependent methyltransferase
MVTLIKIKEDILKQLCCPACKWPLKLFSEIKCSNPGCQQLFPIVDGIPILINEGRSLFKIQDFINRSNNVPASRSKTALILKKVFPSISNNIKARRNYSQLSDLLIERSNSAPQLLIIGGSVIGQGMEKILSNSSIQLIETDVSFGPRTNLICDAHDIPFKDESFDGVIIQAVLEHVVDPQRCVEEIHRVLKPGGLVYAETPFMQQVHAGRYDFMRFTHLGHRRLFRQFEEINSGAVCGPGMALAWSYWYFLRSFVKSNIARRIIYAFASLTSFWLKYFDYLLINKPGALDAASGYYFLGRKFNQTLPDRDLIQLFRGCDPP